MPATRTTGSPRDPRPASPTARGAAMTLRWFDRNALVARLVPLRRRLQRRRRPPAERRIILHIGAHKTGTSSLQYLLESNHLRLPGDYDLIRRYSGTLGQIKNPIYHLKTAEDALRALPRLQKAAHDLALATPWARVTLVSHEDLMGPLPTRGGVRGLYPFAPAALRAMLDGIAQAGVAAEVVFYTRDWDDWKESVFYYKARKRPDRRHSDWHDRRHGLPDGWEELLTRLRRAAGDTAFHHCRFEDDRDAGLMGLGFLRAAGLSPQQIARLRRVAPRNVTRPETLHPGAAGPADR